MKYNGGYWQVDKADKSFEYALNQNSEEKPNFRTWSIFHKESNRVVGFIMLFRSAACYSDHELEIGIMLDRSAQGKKIPEASFRLVLTYAFTSLNLSKVIARFLKKNLPVERFIKKLGFQLDNYDSTTDEMQYLLTQWEQARLIN